MRASLLRVYLVQIEKMLGAVQKAAGVSEAMQPAALEIATARVHLRQAMVDLPGGPGSAPPAPLAPGPPVSLNRLREQRPAPRRR